MAHPCLSEVESAGTSLTLHTGGNWAGYMPSFSDLSHECADDLSSYIYQSTAQTEDVPVPGVPAGPTVSAAGFAIKNLTALGYSARNVPYNGTGNGVYNSDLAFKDNYVFAGTYEGFRVIDVTNKTTPTQILNYTGCNVGQGDVIVYENILIRSWDAPASASSTCAGQLVGTGFEGIHIFDISDPANPVMKKQLRMASTGNEAGAPSGCGSHTATAVPDKARGYLYIYNGGSSGTCNGIDVVRISLANMADATYLKRVTHGRAGSSCHDNNVLLNVGGTSTSYAMCAGGNGLAMYKFDLTLPAAAEGGVETPTLLWSKAMTGVTTGHSGSFTYDGKYLIYGHEPGGGSAARCQATSTVVERTLYFIDPLTGDVKGEMLHPRPQNSRENCTWHNFNVIPTKAGYYATVGSYQSGISVFDFTNPAAPREIAYADPAPLQNPSPEPPSTGIILGGDWSTYWHNGYIYESDIKRGVITWQLNLAGDATAAQANEHLKRTNTFVTSNPQTQAISYAPDLTGAEIAITGVTPGQTFKQGSTFTPAFTCTDAGGVDSCVGTSATGTEVTNSTLGNKTFKVTAIDSSGNITTKEVAYMVNSVDIPGTVAGGTVGTTLGLTTPATTAMFEPFAPGTAKEYLVTAVVQVTSTAGDAALAVSDVATTGTGRLVNGTATLTNPLQVFATATQGTAGVGGAVGGSAAPTQLITFAAPQTNRNTTLTFRQNITATETLRAGSYGKTLTFTLSTTAP
ncbi:hypothetical protein OM076_17715 [Solirubrobacter ginsenosidimutans]|uniref:Uncharacterized protein n=1 Tax=Solirubrobacter ginsenosidimutans TaxID=490573 RepID=A0A9X3MT96_9ACTN|nr:hypothetical protein [Solirubrobacter ginsenosidimutans]MDA0162115.1 hypothetical protein [Solirubrobacter ginsenosidimutans]